MRELLITTGHNSSAILLEDGRPVWGYETERLTGVKSDSSWPMGPIVERRHDLGRIDRAYVTHWSPNGLLSSMSSKHCDLADLAKIPVISHTPEMSHHDTHIHGAICYAGEHFPQVGTIGVVIDGFGTFGEHLTVYEVRGQQTKVLRRNFGYDTSLGLWYQYATAFMGMKMHEDEYKLLGYEAHVRGADYTMIMQLAGERAARWIDALDSQPAYASKFDPLFNLSALENVKKRIFEELADVCRRMGIDDPSSFDGRSKLALYVQAVLEAVVDGVIRPYRPINLLLAGGVFYNVKLNKVLLDSLQGMICVYPLAGDQGNAIGLYAALHPNWKFPGMLLGQRTLYGTGPEGMMVGTEDEVLDFVFGQLRKVGYVNLVRGAMEFGPRALCNTSTLALPTADCVHRINAMNNRNTVMPMAPVMRRHTYESMFKKSSQVWKSHEHMVIAMEYREVPDYGVAGVAHHYEQTATFTGRPQTIEASDYFMSALLSEFPVLINTSFNYHGMPIPLGMDRICENHLMQRANDSTITTGVICNV